MPRLNGFAYFAADDWRPRSRRFEGLGDSTDVFDGYHGFPGAGSAGDVGSGNASYYARPGRAARDAEVEAQGIDENGRPLGRYGAGADAARVGAGYGDAIEQMAGAGGGTVAAYYTGNPLLFSIGAGVAVWLITKVLDTVLFERSR